MLSDRVLPVNENFSVIEIRRGLVRRGILGIIDFLATLASFGSSGTAGASSAAGATNKLAIVAVDARLSEIAVARLLDKLVFRLYCEEESDFCDAIDLE